MDKGHFSPWMEAHPRQLLSFYPHFQGVYCYGIYSQGIDRFLAVSGMDWSAVLNAAKLLSSKIPTQVFVFPPDSPRITNETCLRWTIKNKDISLSDSQTPVLKVLKSKYDLVEDGVPSVGQQEAAAFARKQEFTCFLLRAAHALRLTDACLNNVDQEFYARFFAETAGKTPLLHAVADDTRWPGGFMARIENILYKSDSIDDALAGFSALLQWAQN